MSSNTKIVVLRQKEVIYTSIFVVLGILFIVLLVILFSPGKSKKESAMETGVSYIPGVYTTSIVLNDNTIDIEVVVDDSAINSIRLVNLDDAVTTMYPLIEPSFAELTTQIYDSQALDVITYSSESKYTSLVLLDANVT